MKILMNVILEMISLPAEFIPYFTVRTPVLWWMHPSPSDHTAGAPINEYFQQPMMIEPCFNFMLMNICVVTKIPTLKNDCSGYLLWPIARWRLSSALITHYFHGGWNKTCNSEWISGDGTERLQGCCALGDDLLEMLESGADADVEILVHEKVLKAHK